MKFRKYRVVLFIFDDVDGHDVGDCFGRKAGKILLTADTAILFSG